MANRNTYRAQGRFFPSALSLTIFAALFAALWSGVASVAAASEVVDLRIGAHADFTRVVFELDRPTGYRIERASPEPGVWELVVSLDASSIPRKVHSQKSLIGLVRITPQGEGSVAHIQLSEDGLSLKEMILANPPRIVLDVLSPARAKRLVSKPAASKPEPKRVAAKTAPAALPAAKPTPSRTAATPTPTPTPTRTPRTAVESPAPSKASVASPGPSTAKKPVTSAAASPSKASAGSKIAESVPGPPRIPRERSARAPGSLAATPVGEPSEGGIPTMGMTMGMQTRPSQRVSPVPAAERVAKRTSLPAAAPNRDRDDSGMGLGALGMGIAALMVLGAAVVFMRRRGTSSDDSEFYEDVGVGEPPSSDTGENPFATLAAEDADQPVLAMSTEPDPVDTGETGATHFEIGALDDEEKQATPVDIPVLGESEVAFGEVDTAVQGIGQAQAAVGPESESEGDEETMRMIREFERRMASLESRLDEVVDARERLERQVAAQTEELRVQRAAIARTQRAVRNMNRPGEEGPTEPALRDPQ